MAAFNFWRLRFQLAEMCRSLWPLLSGKSKTRCRRPDNAAPLDVHIHYQPAIIRLLPHRQPGTRRSPRIHHFFITAIAGFKPFQKIQDQILNDHVTRPLTLPK